MADINSIHSRQWHGQVYRRILMQLTRAHSSRAWSPDINAYLCAGQVIVCVDLAGVEAGTLNLSLEPRRLHIRGLRHSPEPSSAADKPLQVLAMEIDYGPFEREVLLPVEVEAGRLSVEQRNGLLWVRLPLRSETSL